MEKYDVISVVGEGSYGLVMRCRHRESGQYVAIKKFLETEDDPTVRKMAIREIRMLKKLRHENLVNMIEVFRRKKRYFLVFEYLEHTVLEELEARAGGLGFITSKKYIFQVLRALNFIHSHDVIHRDIKPENVLVSRLGVIKLCDFGFARPYAENETFTDYVATRWYRSPELLVGDPRYGKEVDIWAVGCLYSEMMTGEPLFPGESDIDQLFQIIRVLGKLNSRHQHLVTRNAMFKGMKQEQNSSLHQLFPEWNRDCLDFLIQCLKMDGLQRPDTNKLLKHELFLRDNFLDNFIVELRTKISQEMQGNPLLKRMPSYGGSGKSRGGGNDEKKIDKLITTNATNKKNSSGSNNNNSNTVSTDDQRKEKITQIGLSLTVPSSTQLISSHNKNASTDNKDIDELNLTSLKNYLTTNNNNNGNNTNQSNQKQNHKPITVNNLIFKNNSTKYSRVLSAKPQKNSIQHSITQQQQQQQHQLSTNNNFDLQIQPPSPVQFQSLQTENISNSVGDPQQQQQQKRLSPINVNNITINGNVPQYFNHKKSSNIYGLQQKGNIKQQSNIASHQLSTTRTNLMKRDKGTLLDVGLMPLSINTPESLKDVSPRILPPPPWLTGNLKVSSHGKITQIGKRGVITDWKTIGGSHNETEKNEFLLPNCPGASTTTSTNNNNNNNNNNSNNNNNNNNSNNNNNNNNSNNNNNNNINNNNNNNSNSNNNNNNNNNQGQPKKRGSQENFCFGSPVSDEN